MTPSGGKRRQSVSLGLVCNQAAERWQLLVKTLLAVKSTMANQVRGCWQPDDFHEKTLHQAVSAASHTSLTSCESQDVGDNHGQDVAASYSALSIYHIHWFIDIQYRTIRICVPIHFTMKDTTSLNKLHKVDF